MTSEKNYDDFLFKILHDEGNIVGFFDKIFEFLYRRTDYFKIKKDSSSEFGLKPGEAEDIVRSVFCKYMVQAVDQHRQEVENIIEPASLDFIAEEVISSSIPEYNEDQLISPETVDEKESKTTHTTESKNLNQQTDQRVPWMDPDCYNGARFDDYSWAQTIKDLDLRIKVPKYAVTGKQVKVNIDQGSLCAEVLLDGQWETLKKGDFTWKINVEESTWTLVPGEHIHVCLQKLKDRWWDSCFANEPKIDMKSLDPSMPFEDLDEEAQAKIQEIVYNEHQKRLGKPTIQQNKLNDILKDAWNKDGSPFKGQPFDPSLVQIQNTGGL